ncbi:MAG: SagB/ThcOx family dehydrogenase [Spirochaetales bacterium]|nr:SagB/ThcOx family dehydrogenase [Spirochaetales bacterium]
MYNKENMTFLYEIFHEKTKLNEINNDEMGLRIYGLYQEPYLLYAMSQTYKVYPYKKKFKLEKEFEEKYDFHDVVIKRCSTREFVKHDIGIHELSQLFFFSYGITHSIKTSVYGEEKVQYFRAVPSGGALYPLEMYIVLLSARDIPAGLYHYNVIDHSVELLSAGDYRADMLNIMPNQFSLDTASAIVVISAIFSRNTIKYGERGYRFVLLDAGHLMQNVHLSVTSMDLGCYAVGGFSDDGFNDLFSLDGYKETALYASVIGKSK